MDKNQLLRGLAESLFLISKNFSKEKDIEINNIEITPENTIITYSEVTDGENFRVDKFTASFDNTPYREA